MANLGNTVVNGALRVINKANVVDLDVSGTLTEGGKSLTDKYAGKTHTHAYVSGLSISGKTISYTKGDGSTGTLTTQDTVYTHPSYTKRDSGIYKITVDDKGHVSAATAVTKADLTGLGLPSSNTDTLMTQTVNTGETALPILTGATASPSGAATGAYAAGVTITPKTNTVTATTFKGALSGNASTASKLSAARSITVNLASTTAGSFDGSADVKPGVTGTLPIANGGTGATTAAGALTSLGLTASAAEINTLKGITATTAELNYTDGVTSNIQTQLNAKAPTASPALTGTPTAPTASAGTNTTQIATTAFVKTAINNVLTASDAMVFKGTIGGTNSGATITALPASHQTGDTYKVITAGTYAGAKCEIGDMVICTKTGTASADADWTVVQTNIDGAVTGPASAVADRVVTFSGTTGKVIKDSGFTIGKSVPSDAKFSDTVYTHPTHTAYSSGLYKVTVNNLGHVTAATAVAKGDITALGIPGSDTTYSDMKGASSSVAGTHGLVPAPAAGKQTSFLRGDGTWAVPTDTNTHANSFGKITNGTTTISAGTATDTLTLATSGSAGITFDATNKKLTFSATDTKYTHPNITATANTSTASPAHGKTFTAIDSVTVNSNGHVTAYNTKTVTLPSETALSKTDSGSGNAVTGITVSGHSITVTKDSTFSLSTHTHNYAGSSSAGGPLTAGISWEAGTTDTDRNVWFSDTTSTTSIGKPVYDNDFKYNPSTNTMKVVNVAASKVTLGAGCSLVYDSTNKCVNFVFA